MILATWNVNSIRVRMPQVLDWLTANRPNVLCMQETKITDDKFPVDEFEKLGYSCVFRGEKSYNGVAIISDRPMTNVHKEFEDKPDPDQSRFVEAKIGGLTVIDVYIPNGSEVGSQKFVYKLKWIDCLKRHIEGRHKAENPLLICGDFNVAMEDIDVYDPAAVRGTIMFSDEEKSAIASIAQWGFVDAFRLHNKDKGEYSWWDYRQMAFRRKMGWRIDHVWVTQSVAPLTKRAWIDKEPRKLEQPSDHAPVVIELDDIEEN